MAFLEKICCFFVFARIFLHMCPNEKYEKYLSALTSWIAFCIFISPIMSGDAFKESYVNFETNWEKATEVSFEEETAEIIEEVLEEDG